MIDKDISYEDRRLTPKEKKKIKPANQGGGPNYLGKQETVTVPKKWLSDPDHVVAELAYITPREKKMLLDADLYGSLKGKPNKGPEGIPSLQGDMGGFGGTGGPSGGNNGGGNDRENRRSQQYGQSRTTTQKGTLSDPAEKRDYFTQAYSGPKGFLGIGGGYKDLNVANETKYGFQDPIGKAIATGIGLVSGIPGLGFLTSNLQNTGQFFKDKVEPYMAKQGMTPMSYDDYISARTRGEIDAYGREITNTGGDNQSQLTQQAAMINPLANLTVETPQENLQGGVAQLYNQYMRNLGYTL